MKKKLKKLLNKLGPGVVTGASDDDPSGIATYSLAGASQGFSLLWTAFLTFPLMATIQEMCARIGLVTQRGLAGNIKTHYKSKILLYSLTLLIVVANTINIGADLAGMSAAIKLFVPISPLITNFIITALIIGLLVYFPYKFIVGKLKWLTFALFAYIASAVVIEHDWGQIIFSTFVPKFTVTNDFIILVVAILGTTISPYLFFWQASEEVEEIKEEEKEKHKKIIVTKNELKIAKEDVSIGMLFSNIVMFAIIATTASTLFSAGIHEINTADEAARALEPIAGRASSFLFTLGIIGTGFLAIPVLAGSAGYAVSETFGWREGLSYKFRQAKSFYGIIIVSMVLGLLITLINVNPFKALFYTAVIYGLISPILIFFILLLANNPKVMGKHVNTPVTNILGLITFLIMTAAAIGFFVTL
ncbi:iron transporter [Candidatus Curtissbacteria bacterium RIFCSPLOWO2_02_FULL_40_11]|uniref:Iron transporter n=2 Tax=Candidatus Curtissiibacteriota TaxID=1752717 RepID=A0A1F5GCA0_9BACT|nr:MAG: iron transporter [Candidatus Curtissbacteria bacterium RIFCSPHIGHO2_02_FULL_40_16b]OGE00767.1 MAG: iron transporter [Candidatus Curtissbacteria bacterium RIFCSPLOWO2_02_FULL_40_11]OGE14253.1 MAG: iron transporter [Candidatus Curtissbacteria bacterium RIFCSPLOWO2_12_FULL_38_9]